MQELFETLLPLFATGAGGASAGAGADDTPFPQYRNKCIFNSVIGGNHSTMTFKEYVSYMSTINEVFGVIHAVTVACYLGVIIFTVWRKDHMTLFQWLIMGGIICLNAVEMAYTFSWNGSMISHVDCGKEQKLYLAAMYILYYIICIFMACKNELLFRQITQFVKAGDLPKSFVRSRHFLLLGIVAVCAIGDWFFYTFYLGYLTKREEMKAAWNLNFAEQCIISGLVGTSLIFLALSHSRISKLRKQLTSPENDYQLSLYHRITKVSFLGQFLFLLAILFGIYTQGVWGPIAILQNTLSQIMFLANEIAFFIMIYRNNLDLILKTQVLASGRIVLTGTNRWGQERLNLKMNKSATGEAMTAHSPTNDQAKRSQSIVSMGWANISSEGSDGDMTSNGGANLSPMSVSTNNGAFVAEFNGQGQNLPSSPSFRTTINPADIIDDDSNGGSPKFLATSVRLSDYTRVRGPDQVAGINSQKNQFSKSVNFTEDESNSGEFHALIRKSPS